MYRISRQLSTTLSWLSMSGQPRTSIFVAVVGCGLVGSDSSIQLLSFAIVSPFKLIYWARQKDSFSSIIQPNWSWCWLESCLLHHQLLQTEQLTLDYSALLRRNASRWWIYFIREVAGLYPLWLKQGINTWPQQESVLWGRGVICQNIEHIEGKRR